MASRKDIELASLLFRSGILSQEEIQSALGHQGKLLTEGQIVGLPEILAERGLIPPEAVATFSDTPLNETQPFPDYELAEQIGEGASSTVYRGIYKPRELPVAVKVLLPEQELMRKPLKRFMRESHLLCKLRHHNIIRGYEVRKIAGWRFLSMEWFPGNTILEHIEKRGRLDGPTALHVARQIASALSCLHENRIIHRDIKPGNVLVDDDWTVKLIDLGLCRMLDAPPSEEADGTTVGTVGYLSPEQAKGATDLDIRSDIYSLGVSLYHMVIGEVPFTGDDDFEVMSKQIMQRLGSDELKRLNISPNVHYTIEKMMAKDRDMRYQHPDEIVAELDAYLKTIDYRIIPIARPPTENEASEKKKGAIVAPTRKRKSSKKIDVKRKRGKGDVKPKAPTSRRRRYR
jgi:serine/threonine-protein kinase